jgi:hypothetical protein
MTTEAKRFDLHIPFNRHLSDIFAICYMIRIWTMAKFTGYCFVDTSLMNKSDWTMALVTGFIGVISHLNIPLILKITTAIVAILPHCVRQKQASCPNTKNTCYD